jgi:hypothetical protein
MFRWLRKAKPVDDTVPPWDAPFVEPEWEAAEDGGRIKVFLVRVPSPVFACFAVDGIADRLADVRTVMGSTNRHIKLESDPCGHLKVIGCCDAGQLHIGYVPGWLAKQIARYNLPGSVFGILDCFYEGITEGVPEIHCQIYGSERLRDHFVESGRARLSIRGAKRFAQIAEHHWEYVGPVVANL